MKKKTTKKDFELFQDTCEKWVDIFGLLDWEILFKHEDDDSIRASCTTDIQGKVCTLALSRDWSNSLPITDRAIKDSAFHEVCELLIAPLGHIAMERFCRLEEIEQATHGIIRRLENMVIPDE